MVRLTRRSMLGGSAAAALIGIYDAKSQAAWPSKPIRIIVPYPAGGQTDGTARAFGDYLSRELRTSTIVENRSGAGGVIGITEAKRANPDGYTILCTISSSLIQNRVTIKNLPYDPDSDFTYLSMVTGKSGPVVAAKKTGAANLQQFVDYAKKVGTINWGSYGAGSTPHVMIETVAQQYGFKFQVIQYRGEAPMWTDLAGQTLDGAAGSYAAAVPIIQSGSGVLIGLTGDRSSLYPDVPTLIEQGAVGEFYNTKAFTTFAVPAGTPADVAQRISEVLEKAGSDAKTQAALSTFNLNKPIGMEAAQRIFKDDSSTLR